MATSIGVTSAGAQLELQSELLPGESLFWAGQPSRRVLFRRSDWFVIPFSFMWGGFTIFWVYDASGYVGGHPFSQLNWFALWGVPFVIIGQYFIWGRFFYVVWKKARTFYGVTNKRVLVLGTATSRRLTDSYLRSLNSVTLTTGADGVGTIEFAPEPETGSMWGYYGSRRRSNFPIDIDLSRLAFFDIENAKSIYQMIQNQRERSQSDKELV